MAFRRPQDSSAEPPPPDGRDAATAPLSAEPTQPPVIETFPSSDQSTKARIEAVLDQPLCPFGNADVWTLRDAVQGTQIFGATGSGKTSGSGRALAVAFLRAGFGGLVLTVKPGDLSDWRKYMSEAGRPESDLAILGPPSRHRFNFLSHELTESKGAGGITQNLVSLFTTALSAGNVAVSQDDPYWNDALRELLIHAIDLAALATGKVRLADLNRLVAEAAKSAAEARSPRWQSSSFTWKLLRRIEARRREFTAEEFADLRLTAAYWMEDFPNLSEKTRSIIVSCFTSKASMLLRRPLRRLLCTRISPEVTPARTHEGKVVLLNLPVKEYGEVGRFAQILYKTVWQRATERRKFAEGWRPVFLWADEAQHFITSEDMMFQQTARSTVAATVYLTQNLPNYYAALGSRNGNAATHSLLGNLQTKIFHANGDPATNEWAERVFAKDWRARRSSSTYEHGGASVGMHDHFVSTVEAREFTMLPTGGPAHKYQVGAIVFQAGRPWKATDDNYLRHRFPQRTEGGDP